MKSVIIIEAQREGYSIDQCYKTMTAGELIQTLSEFDENTPIYFSHDNGYTYGSLRAENIDERQIKEEDDYLLEGMDEEEAQEFRNNNYCSN